jgi:hypothetical protein
MAVDNLLNVPKARDQIVFSFLLAAAKIIGAEFINIQSIGAGRASQYAVAGEESANVSPYAASDRYLIHKGSINVSHFSLTYSRDPKDQATIAFDSVIVRNTGWDAHPQKEPLSEDAFFSLQTLISDTFLATTDQHAALFRDPKAFKELMRSHQQMLERLEDTLLQVGENAAAARSQLEDEYWKKNSELRRQYDERQANADKTLAESRDEVRQQKEALDDQKRVLDDRSNTHARRELHRDLKAKIAQRADSLRVTPETTANRRPIHIAVLWSAAFLSALTVYFSVQFTLLPSSASTTQTIIAGLKPASITIALLGLIAWYLRWMNRWFERYADTEFHLKQFELDIDRASWVVETALEWKLSQDRPMPEHLLETISRNLFSKSEKDESADIHPADYLASAILGRASALNLKVPGGEISLTGKDIKRLQKDEVQTG